MRTDDQKGEELDISAQQALGPWLLAFQWHGKESVLASLDDEVRTLVASLFLLAAVEAKQSGDAKAQSKYTAEAQSLLETIGQPGPFDYVAILGVSLAELGRTEEAVPYLLRAVDLGASCSADEGSMASLYRYVRDCYEAQERFDLAEPWAAKWAEWMERTIAPGGQHEANAECYLLLGLNYGQYKNWGLAVERLETAERLGLPPHGLHFAMQLRAFSLEASGRWEEAIPIWEQLRDQAEGPRLAAHFAELLGYARGRVDAKLGMETRPLPFRVVGCEGEGLDSRAVEAGAREHQWTRIGVFRVSQQITEIGNQVGLLRDALAKVARRPDEKLGDMETQLQQTLSAETWVQLQAESRSSLISGELLYQEYSFVGTFDLGKVALYFTGALEVEVRALVLRPLVRWLAAAKKEEVKVRNKPRKTADLQRLGLGDTVDLLQSAARGEIPEIQEWARRQSPAIEEFLLRQLPWELKDISGLRNPPSHGGSLTKFQLDDLHHKIVGSAEQQGLLKRLVDLMATRGTA